MLAQSRLTPIIEEDKDSSLILPFPYEFIKYYFILLKDEHSYTQPGRFSLGDYERKIEEAVDLLLSKKNLPQSQMHPETCNLFKDLHRTFIDCECPKTRKTYPISFQALFEALKHPESKIKDLDLTLKDLNLDRITLLKLVIAFKYGAPNRESKKSTFSQGGIINQLKFLNFHSFPFFIDSGVRASNFVIFKRDEKNNLQITATHKYAPSNTIIIKRNENNDLRFISDNKISHCSQKKDELFRVKSVYEIKEEGDNFTVEASSCSIIINKSKLKAILKDIKEDLKGDENTQLPTQLFLCIPFLQTGDNDLTRIFFKNYKKLAPEEKNALAKAFTLFPKLYAKYSDWLYEDEKSEMKVREKEGITTPAEKTETKVPIAMPAAQPIYLATPAVMQTETKRPLAIPKPEPAVEPAVEPPAEPTTTMPVIDLELERIKESVKTELDKYRFGWFKYRIFGHHHKERAAEVNKAIEEAQTVGVIRAILENQRNLFLKKSGLEETLEVTQPYPITEVPMTSTLRQTRFFNQLINTKQGGFYTAVNLAISRLPWR